jgi:hypothetical protein
MDLEINVIHIHPFVYWIFMKLAGNKLLCHKKKHIGKQACFAYICNKYIMIKVGWPEIKSKGMGPNVNAIYQVISSCWENCYKKVPTIDHINFHSFIKSEKRKLMSDRHEVVFYGMGQRVYTVCQKSRGSYKLLLKTLLRKLDTREKKLIYDIY